MDPSEIIALPYSFSKLSIFVAAPVLFVTGIWLVTVPNKLLTKIFRLTRLTLITYALFGICGTHIVTDYRNSIAAALYAATLASTTWTSSSTTSSILDDLPFYDYPKNALGFCQLYGMMLISTVFQILNVLDRGLQVQRWPLPVIFGTTYGYVIGSFAGIVCDYLRRTKEKGGR